MFIFFSMLIVNVMSTHRPPVHHITSDTIWKQCWYSSIKFNLFECVQHYKSWTRVCLYGFTCLIHTYPVCLLFISLTCIAGSPIWSKAWRIKHSSIYGSSWKQGLSNKCIHVTIKWNLIRRGNNIKYDI